ncbi:MAG: reverse transcriptase domain-containing protein, partial [Candidatus Thiodiazotropha sp.]
FNINLSPVLFAIFLNDLEDYLVQHNCNGITLDSNNQGILLYLKIFVLLYADDTVVFGTDATSFQENLNYFYEYTRIWKLKINYDKTKIMIFGTRNDDQFEFRIGESFIAICDEFKYLGVIFSKSRSFYKAMRHNVDQAKKALHLLYKRIRNLHLPIDLQLHLFDHTILPILLYGCEVWGYQNTKMIETVHNQFLRYITKLRKSTPIYMLYGELGRYPVEITIKTRMIGFWISTVNSNDAKISKILYNMLYNESIQGHNFKWINSIKDILISVGRFDLFQNNIINYPKATKIKISQTLKDLNIQTWNSDLLNSSKGRNYQLFKDDICLENYLLVLPKNTYIPLIKFRTANHKLPIEKGRWNNIPHEDRKCSLCNTNDIGDEFHYVFICPFFATEREALISPYYYARPNILKFKTLLQSHNKKVLIQLSKFFNVIMQKFH